LLRMFGEKLCSTNGSSDFACTYTKALSSDFACTYKSTRATFIRIDRKKSKNCWLDTRTCGAAAGTFCTSCLLLLAGWILASSRAKMAEQSGNAAEQSSRTERRCWEVVLKRGVSLPALFCWHHRAPTVSQPESAATWRQCL